MYDSRVGRFRLDMSAGPARLPRCQWRCCPPPPPHCCASRWVGSRWLAPEGTAMVQCQIRFSVPENEIGLPTSGETRGWRSPRPSPRCNRPIRCRAACPPGRTHAGAGRFRECPACWNGDHRSAGNRCRQSRPLSGPPAWIRCGSAPGRGESQLADDRRSERRRTARRASELAGCLIGFLLGGSLVFGRSAEIFPPTARRRTIGTVPWRPGSVLTGFSQGSLSPPGRTSGPADRASSVGCQDSRRSSSGRRLVKLLEQFYRLGVQPLGDFLVGR